MGVKIEKDNSITISGFEGIGQSPLSDFTDMLGINNSSNPGVAGVNFKFNQTMEKRSDIAWTYFGNSFNNGQIETDESVKYRGAGDYQAVLLKTTGTLPTGLSTGTIYWIKGMFGGDADKALFLATSLQNAINGTYIDFSGAGTGTHTLELLSPYIVRGSTKDKNGNLYFIDNQRRIWWSKNGYERVYCLGQAPSAGTGQGIIYYKGYILIFGANKIDSLKEINEPETALSWQDDIAGVNISITMNPEVGQMGAVPYLSVNDGAIYFNNGNPTSRGDWRLGLFEENVGETFNPATPSTFTCVPDAIYLPDLNGQGYATAINEVREHLIIGTRSNEIFIWDKKSPSFTSKITLPESGVRFIEVKNETAYILAGLDGNAYISNLTSIEPLFKIPETITGNNYSFDTINGGSYKVYYTASALYKVEILFAIDVFGYGYVMSYNTTNGTLLKKNISALGEYLMSDTASISGYISHILTEERNIIIGAHYKTNSLSTYVYTLESLLIRRTVNSGELRYICYDDYKPNIITGLLSYGTYFDKKTLRRLYISLMKPFGAFTVDSINYPEGLKIYYRRSTTDTWTLIKTIDNENYGTIKDIQLETPITDIIDIQFKIELNGNNMNSPQLKLIQLIP